jgi:hypothetical protein
MKCTKPVRLHLPRKDQNGALLSDSSPLIVWMVKLIRADGSELLNLFQHKRDARAFRKVMHNASAKDS